MTNEKPLKRAASLIPLSKDHHQALLLSWKIKTGFAKGVSASRIKTYTDWFYKTHLLPHFEIEEKHIFPILGNENPLIQQALAEHKSLLLLFNDTLAIETSLQQIQVELEKHIRFEERILFNEIKKTATNEELKIIEKSHSDDTFIDNTNDVFWT